MNCDEAHDDSEKLTLSCAKAISAGGRKLLRLTIRALGHLAVGQVEGEHWITLHFADSPTIC